MTDEKLTGVMRDWCTSIRTRPAPLADAIPMVQQAADRIDAMATQLSAMELERDRLRQELEDVKALLVM